MIRANHDYSQIRKVLDDAFFSMLCRGANLPTKKKKMVHKFRFPCRQQPIASKTCGYYVCAHMDEIVRAKNPHWKEKDFQKFSYELGNEKYDWKKDFRRIQQQFTYIIMNDVTRPGGEFYAGVQLPPSES